MSAAISVQPGDAVLLHFDLLLPDGSVADSSRASGKPALFRLGDESLSETIEAALLGLLPGEKKKFFVPAAEAFGEHQNALVSYIDRHLFSDDIEVVEGAIVLFTQRNGDELPGVIRGIAGHSVTVDFNHPLAGKDVHFDVEVLAINPESTGV